MSSKKSRGEKGDKGERGIQGPTGKDGSSILFVATADCTKKHDKLELTLFGADGMGGIVRDIQIIKTATSIVRTVILPVALSICSAAFIAFLLTR